MTNVCLGRLEKVPLRDIWPNEARDFTPWLAQPENIALLGEVVGMQLEVVAKEQSVGPFKVDIECKDRRDNSSVVIENQLEPTDHSHLGQLLTYAANLDADTIIWISKDFRKEHRKALDDLLNEKTLDGIRFFGLEIELWRIGNSPVAPKFNVICEPKEWKQTKIRNNLADLCKNYWSGVLEALASSGIVEPGTTPYRKEDMLFPVGWKSFWLKSYFSTKHDQIGVWVAARRPRGLKNFQCLEDAKDKIEEAFGEPLEWKRWEKHDEGNCTKIYDDYDPEDRSDWGRQHALLAEKLVALHAAVAPMVAKLDIIEDD